MNVFPLVKMEDANTHITAITKLIYRGKLYDNNSIRISAIPTHKGNKGKTTFSPSSNFCNTTLKIDNNVYSSTVQYYQAVKARRHKDNTTLKRILITTDPYEINKISRQIKTKPALTQQVEG